MLSDDRRAWILDSSDTWRRAEELVDEPTGLDAFEALMAMAKTPLPVA
jgi:hypothetical protein